VRCGPRILYEVRKLIALVVLVGVGMAVAAPFAAGGRAFVEDRFVRAANRGDYAAVCRLYSHRYLKISQAGCRQLYRSAEGIFGPYDYRIVGRRILPSGHRRADMVLRHHRTFVEFAREPAGWRIVAGGF
jgi:hypothetical protein